MSYTYVFVRQFTLTFHVHSCIRYRCVGTIFVNCIKTYSHTDSFPTPIYHVCNSSFPFLGVFKRDFHTYGNVANPLSREIHYRGKPLQLSQNTNMPYYGHTSPCTYNYLITVRWLHYTRTDVIPTFTKLQIRRGTIAYSE